MKIVVIGAGVIGSAIARWFEGEHEIVVTSRSRGNPPVDIESRDSIRRLFDAVAPFDALVCAAGEAWLGPFEQLDHDKVEVGLRSKLLGQLDLVFEGRAHVSERGSFTLTSGFLSSVPAWGTAGLGIVNGAIESFVKHAATALSPVRINAVSPGAVEETVRALGRRHPPLLQPVSIERVMWAYARAVTGTETGCVLSAHE